MDTVIAPASAEAAAASVSEVRENRDRVEKYLARLKEVRQKRSAMEVSTASDHTDAACWHTILPETFELRLHCIIHQYDYIDAVWL